MAQETFGLVASHNGSEKFVHLMQVVFTLLWKVISIIAPVEQVKLFLKISNSTKLIKRCLPASNSTQLVTSLNRITSSVHFVSMNTLESYAGKTSPISIDQEEDLLEESDLEISNLELNDTITEKTPTSVNRKKPSIFETALSKVNSFKIKKSPNNSQPKGITVLDNEQKTSTPKRKYNSPIEHGEVKKSRVGIMSLPTLASIVQKVSYVVDILPDVGEEEMLFTKEHTDKIKASFHEAMFAFDKVADLDIDFDIICGDTFTRDWVTETTPLLNNLWSDAKLKVVIAGSPPKMVRATIDLPIPAPEPSKFFMEIGIQNKLDTQFWRVYNYTLVSQRVPSNRSRKKATV